MSAPTWRSPPCQDCTGEGLCSFCSDVWDRTAALLADGQRPTHLQFAQLDPSPPWVSAEGMDPDAPMGAVVTVDVLAWAEVSNWSGMADELRCRRLRAEALARMALGSAHGG